MSVLDLFERPFREWFRRKFKRLTPPQEKGIPYIFKGYNVLITAPTGSGKTLAGFACILNKLIKLSHENELEDRVYCIYVSPLRALNRDIYKNLISPLNEIKEIAKEIGYDMHQEIRIFMRTGDTKESEKQKMLKKPPHILITTPETLAISISTPKFSRHLKNVEFCIVDEIHELANKRGVHLSLSLERLNEYTNFQRIGLGATLEPKEEIARFLAGYDENGNPRKIVIIDATWDKKYDIRVICPVKDLIYSTNEEINDALYKTLDELIEKHRTTLIFTNTRAGAERVVLHLRKKFPNKYNENVQAHHGSMSRELRFEVEDKLKEGKLKAVASSVSLELGIDIGYIDLVAQIGSPKSVTKLIQRVGRSGHGFEEVAKGRIIALDRDDLVEVSVMAKAAIERKLDRVKIPRNCLDILAQHILGMALEKKWNVNDMYKVIRRSYCYKDLSYEEFLNVIKYLAGKYVDLEYQRVYAKIWYDEAEGKVGRKRGSRVIYYLNIGAIPDEVKVDVYELPGRKYIGNIEEEFLERLSPGDIFQLGGRYYRFKYAVRMNCYVERVPENVMPNIPIWFSELLPLSFDLALEIQRFREIMRKKITNEDRDSVIKWLLENYPVDENSAENIYNYFLEQYKHSYIPGYKEILIEITKDLNDRNFIIFHALFGRRCNEALSRFFGKIISEKINRNVAIVLNDNGFGFIVPFKINVNEIIEEAMKRDIEEELKEVIRRTELFKRRFRHVATRSFLILKNYKGHKISVEKQQINAENLIRILEEMEGFPVIKETYREILEDVFDIDAAKKVLNWIRNGEVTIKIIETDIPSPFSHNLILLSEADVIFMEDRKKRLMELHRKLMEKLVIKAE